MAWGESNPALDLRPTANHYRGSVGCGHRVTDTYQAFLTAAQTSTWSDEAKRVKWLDSCEVHVRLVNLIHHRLKGEDDVMLSETFTA
ncbi:hypothetical protein Q7C36_016454 [Tachysurus vachellii]|uniref:Uncharacterized protein n=1 Tax=Tachysurus vachellii TaxID=175792 RepID=A0AA88M896_TACVA|nr:hypothetical protein Q7C36_016454 [Tachysurus vachellii]